MSPATNRMQHMFKGAQPQAVYLQLLKLFGGFGQPDGGNMRRLTRRESKVLFDPMAILPTRRGGDASPLDYPMPSGRCKWHGGQLFRMVRPHSLLVGEGSLTVRLA